MSKDVQTIELTGKRYKGQLLLSGILFWVSVVWIMGGIMTQGDISTPTWLLWISLIWWVVTKFLIWWHHR